MPLILDLLRHGEAAATGTGGDAERPLTPRGEDMIRGIAARLGDTATPERVFSSPLKRALQSASILASGIGLEAAVEELDELTPEHDPEALLGALERLGVTDGHVLLVGHQPQIGNLIDFVTGTRRRVRPGELVRIECPAGAGRRQGSVALDLAPE
jgi:phosphohistidine phosphatase